MRQRPLISSSPTILAVLSVAFVLLVAGCSSPGSGRTTGAACCLTNVEALAVLPERSVYQLDSVWTNDLAQPVPLTALRGRVQVMAMIFSNCQVACPLIVRDLKRIEAALPDHVRERVGFTLVTIDVVRDTPDALRAYRERQQLLRSRWTLLRGGADDTLELAALLGVKFKPEASGQFSHSNLITVLDPEGEITYQQAGLNREPDDAVRAIQRAASTPPVPSNR